MAVVHDRPRPDPQLGIFETLLVIDGQPVEIDAHQARLEASIEALLPDRSAPALEEEIRSRAREVGLGALRTTVAPDPKGGLRVRHESGPARGDFLNHRVRKSPRRTVALRSIELTGGLGAHKWADRSLLDAAQAQLPADSLPLLVDADGTVLEASRANIFAVRDGALFTPPLDGRILPGVTRARVLEIATTDGLKTREAELSQEDLLAADEVFLTGSIRGIEPVRALDGAPVAQDGDVAARLATELRKAWLGAPVG